MKEYKINYNNKDYDISKHDTSFQLNIVQKDALDRESALSEFQRKEIKKLISSENWLKEELEVVNSDNHYYRTIIIKLIKALYQSNFCDQFIQNDIAKLKGKLNYRNVNFIDFNNTLADFIEKDFNNKESA